MGIIEEADEPFPDGKRVAARLAGSAFGQHRLAHLQDVSADLGEQRRSLLMAQNMASGVVHLLVASLGIDREQLAHQFHRADRGGILFVEFDRIYEVSSGMAPAGRVHHLRTAHAIVGRVSICLEKAFEVSQEVQRAFPFAAHAEIEDRHAARRSILPEIGLMVRTAAVARLHIDRGFIGLDVDAGKQLAPYRSG